MGLDMYLSARKFLWTSFDKSKPNRDDEISNAIRELVPEIGDMKPRYIEVEAMYWRKANHIHAWFVDNVQDGNDDCGYYTVSREQLQELAELCEQALADPDFAVENLPTRSGFFFGGTEYDEYYLDMCQDTAAAIRKILENPGFNEGYWEFQYHSSW